MLLISIMSVLEASCKVKAFNCPESTVWGDRIELWETVHQQKVKIQENQLQNPRLQQNKFASCIFLIHTIDAGLHNIVNGVDKNQTFGALQRL